MVRTGKQIGGHRSGRKGIGVRPVFGKSGERIHTVLILEHLVLEVMRDPIRHLVEILFSCELKQLSMAPYLVENMAKLVLKSLGIT